LSESLAAQPERDQPFFTSRARFESRRTRSLDRFERESAEADQEANPSLVASPTVPVVTVHPSREEAWSENFRLVKEFYDAKGHLTLPRDDPQSLRLTQWLTYQRHQSKGLKKDQLERLESINYNDLPVYREDDEKEWLTF
jgi:hypothetical protein